MWRRIRGSFNLSVLGLQLGLIAASVTAVYSLSRLFTDSSPVVTVAVAALLTHGVSIAARWARLPWIAGVFISAVVLIGSVCTAQFPATMRLRMFPTGETIDAINRSLVEAWNTFLSVRAPTEPQVGFTLVAVAGAWLVATLTDAIAYRLGFLIEALVPSAIVVVLCAALSNQGDRASTLLPYVAAVCVVVGSARVRELARDAWLGPKPRRAGAVGAAAFVATALATVSYAVTNPPSWVREGLVDFQKDTKAPSRAKRTASNPLVTTRAHLVNLSDTEMFSAQTDRAGYWRLTSLDTYVDDQWTASRGQYDEEKSQDPGDADRMVEITLNGLDPTWLPVQMNARSVSGEHPDGTQATVAYDRYSDSILLDDQAGEGDRYQVVVQDPGSEPVRSLNIAQRAVLLRLPDDLPSDIEQLARQVTTDGVTELDRMQLLEQFFRSQFTYDINVARSETLGIQSFLFEVRRGYCEQFASSFAVMARALGVPSRVATGFVTGQPTPGGYRVTGQDAHAWPEVFVDGRWVAFEPTPNRGIADPEQPASTTVPPTTTPGSAPATPPTPPTTNASGSVDNLDPVITEPTSNSASVWSLLRWLLLLLAVGMLWCTPAGVRRVRTHRGLVPDSLAIDPHVAAAWRTLEDDLAWIGFRRSAAEPIEAWTRRMKPGGKVDWDIVRAIGDRVETLRYQPDIAAASHLQQGPELIRADDDAVVLEQISAIRRDIKRAMSPRRRLARWLSFSVRPRATNRGVRKIGRSRRPVTSQRSGRSVARRRGVGRR